MKKNTRYPQFLELNGAKVEFRLMTPADGPALTTFLASLPVHDLLFVRHDISHPKVIARWLDSLGDGVTSLAAYAGDELVGCTAVVVDSWSWSAHVGDLRVLVAPDWRGCGLGRLLIGECVNIAVAMDLEKLTVQMTVDQSAAIAALEQLGFSPESVLRNYVKDHEGRAFDLALLSLEVKNLHIRSQARGMSTAMNA